MQLDNTLTIDRSSEVPSTSHSVLAMTAVATLLEWIYATRGVTEMINPNKQIDDGATRETRDAGAADMLDRHDEIATR
jgi:hypothetical protein